MSRIATYGAPLSQHSEPVRAIAPLNPLFASGQPIAAFGPEFRQGSGFIAGPILCGKNITPATVHAAVDEGLRAALPEDTAPGGGFARIRFHVVE